MKRNGSKREVIWLIVIVVLVALAARLVSWRQGGSLDTRIVWTERFGERVVVVDIRGSRSSGGRVVASDILGDHVVASLDEPVSASDYASLIDTLEAAGAWTADSQVPVPGRLPHNDLLLESGGRTHEVAFESRQGTPEYAMIDAAVDHGFIGYTMGRLRNETGPSPRAGHDGGMSERERRGPGRGPGRRPPERDPGRGPMPPVP